MKKLLFILLVSNFALAQPDIEIRLVNQYVGQPVHDNPLDWYACSRSDDPGLNLILDAYGVTSYISKAGHPYQPYYANTISIAGVFPSEFITDLLAYSSVISYAKVSDVWSFADALDLELTNAAVGVATGVSNNIIVTNDNGLNQIFQNYNVFLYEQLYPNYPTYNTLYQLACNCDAAALSIALLNYNTVISTTSPHGAVYLANHQFETSKATISPNPFSDTFNITTKELITYYTIVDITGKTITSTTSKNDLDQQSSQLSAGMYVLNLQFENGQSANYKLVKK